MIHLRLSGGLGNQLFQILGCAFAAARHEHNVTVYPQSLSRYNVIRQPDFLKVLALDSKFKVFSGSNMDLGYLFSVVGRAGKFLPRFGINDRNFSRVLNGNYAASTMFFDGYFQNYWRSSTFYEALSCVTVKPISIEAQSRIDPDEVAVHIRGGDFLHLPDFKVVDENYYIKAVKKAVDFGYDKFAIITDDFKYAEAVLQKIWFSVSNISIRCINRGGDALEDFGTLRAASSRIIGNSTFAWWATALSPTSGPTWAPDKFIKNLNRDFFLASEIPIKV